MTLEQHRQVSETSAHADLAPKRRARARRKAPGVRPEDSQATVGRKVLLYHLDEMLRHETGALAGEDIEEVHDMRVTVRRMRAALQAFEPGLGGKRTRPYRKRLRALGRVLGDVRDLDVALANARGFAADNNADLIALTEGWGRARERARVRLRAHIEGSAYESFVGRFRTFLEEPGGAERRDAAPMTIRWLAPERIYHQFGLARARGVALEGASMEAIHRLRIQLKRFRYLLEFLEEILGEQAGDVIRETKRVQDHLGELNDADVACRSLSRFLARWEERHKESNASERASMEAVIAYLAAQHARRQALLAEVGAVWAAFDRPPLREKLALAVAAL